MPEKFEFVYASFLIRLWHQTGPLSLEIPADWHSEVEHIQSGQRWKFDTLEDLSNFLRQQPGKLESHIFSRVDMQD